jgi:hypothetical protein
MLTAPTSDLVGNLLTQAATFLHRALMIMKRDVRHDPSAGWCG